MKLSSLIGQTLDEKYLIERQLGKGGMGAVYLATHIGTARPVAVKVITPQFMANDEFVERFKREAKAAGRLRHPNVVDVTDFGFAQVGNHRVAYLVMEYLDGCSLGDILAEESRLPVEWVIDILEQACSAVDEAHRQGIVHRDLKPDNIWLEPNRRGGYTVKVLDFGLAKLGDRVTADLPPGIAPAAKAATDELSASPERRANLATQAFDRSKTTQIVENETHAYPPDFDKESQQTRLMHPDGGAAKTQAIHPTPGNRSAQTQITPQSNHEGDALKTRVMNPQTAAQNAQSKETPEGTQTAAETDANLRPHHAGQITRVQNPGDGARLSLPAELPDFSALDDLDEAQTLIQPLQPLSQGQREAAAPASDEAQTRIQLADEAQTRIQLSEEERTQILDPQTLHEERTRILTDASGTSSSPISFDSADGLTRVGSVLGTPLYMSPEQCNSLPLDWRTDIYSLGVIAYQMLSGATPFSGDISAVMRQHCDDKPPPFKAIKARVRKRKRKFKIPRRVEQVVMMALEKNREDRPQTAAAFAGMLRSNSEGAGALLRRAVALYSENFPKFFAVSVLVNLPSIGLLILQIVSTVLVKSSLVTQLTGTIAEAIFGIIKLLLGLIAGSILAGITVRMVVQLMLAPLRPIRARQAFAALKKRLRPLIWTMAMVSVLMFLGFVLCLLPGIWFMVIYALTMPVVVMENLSGRKAMKRARQLSKRSRRTMLFVVLIQLGIPLLSTGVISFILGLIAQGRHINPIVMQRVTDVFRVPIDILFLPLISIMTALLYLTMRQSGGENLNETLAEFEQHDMPTTKWQMRMRDRLSIATPGKGVGSRE